MNTIKSFFLLSTLALSMGCKGQLKNTRTLNVKIDGDCGMCEKTIERVGTVKGESDLDRDVDTHIAKVTFDSTRTDLDAILQRVAQSGYDNERFLAPKEAYDKLPGCCQYDRTLVKAPLKGSGSYASTESAELQHDLADAHAEHGDKPIEQGVVTDHLAPVLDAYFNLKNALVASDGDMAQKTGAAFIERLHAVPMEELDHDVHMVWMKVMEQLMEPANALSRTTDLDEQRKAFAQLTGPLMELAKAAPSTTPIYLDHCPMYEGGADWLSRDKPIKNPFYGSMMMSCGSLKETIVQ